MKHKYSVAIRWSTEDECYIGTSPEFDGLSAFGDTQEETLKETLTVLDSFIKIYKEDKNELPDPLLQEYYTQHSDSFEYKGYTGNVTYSYDDQRYYGRVIGAGILLFQGKTLEESRLDFHETIEDYMEICGEMGKKPEEKVEYRYGGIPNGGIGLYCRKSGTDWKRIDAMSDDDIDYSDIPEISDEQLKKGKIIIPAKDDGKKI